MKIIFLTIYLFLISFGNLIACDGDFDSDNLECIQNKIGKIEEVKVEVDPKNINKIYYYKTSNGRLGKLVFKLMSNSPTECTVFLDAKTYLKNSNYNPTNTSLSIRPIFENWETSILNLAPQSTSDFILKKDGTKCYFESVKAKAVYVRSIGEEPFFQRGYKLYYAGLLLIFLSVFLVAKSIFQDEESYKAQELMIEGEEGEKKPVDPSFILRFSRPFIMRYTLPIVMGMKTKNKYKEKYKKVIANSGLGKILSPEQFFAFKLFLIVGFPVALTIIRYLMDADWPLVIIPASSLFGFFYPDIWIRGVIDKRKLAINLQFPFIVDLLALSVEAGLDYMAGIGRVIEKAPPGPLTDEFEQLIKETRIGASRAEALRALAWRVDVVPVTSFCATLISSDQVGASIGPILKKLSDDVRQKRIAYVEEQGAKAAGKIMIPLIFLMVPAIMIIIFLPAIGGMFF